MVSMDLALSLVVSVGGLQCVGGCRSCSYVKPLISMQLLDPYTVLQPYTVRPSQMQ